MERQLLDAVKAVLFTLAALLPIVNPLGSAPIFLSLTADLPGRARRELATVVARYAFLLLTAAMLIGSHVLRLFGVSLPIVRVAGGRLAVAERRQAAVDRPQAGGHVGEGGHAPRVLSADVSADGRTGVDFDCH